MNDPRTNKQILLQIYQQCKEMWPQINILLQRQMIQQWQQPNNKIKKTDCLNPAFLQQLSQCGDNIKNIMKKILRQQLFDREVFSFYYQQFKKIMKTIKKYHEQAHTKYDMHENSTLMKQNLLYELKKQTKRRLKLEQIVKDCQKKIISRQLTIRQMRQNQSVDSSHIKITQISKIDDGRWSSPTKIKKLGQFYRNSEQKIGHQYGYQQKYGQLSNDSSPLHMKVDNQSSSSYIKQLKAQLQSKKQQCLQYNKKLQQHINLKKQYDQLKKSFSQTCQNYRKPQILGKIQTINQSSSDKMFSLCDDYYRLLLIQSLTVQGYLQEQQDNS